MRPGCGWRRWIPVPALAWALAAGLAVSARGDEAPVSIENVHFGFSAQGQDLYEVGAWTPVWVDLKAGPASFQGTLEVIVPDNDGTPTSARRTVGVAAGQMGTFAIYTRPGRRDAEFTVHAYAEGGRRPLATKDIRPDRDPLTPGQSLLLTFGQAAGIEDVPTAAGMGSDPNAPTGQGSSIAVASVRVPAGVPGLWYGYGAADVIVLNSNDRAAVDALDGLKGEALKEWVHQGGHLVVALGEGWQPLAAGPLGALLPARPTGRLQLTDPGALEAFASSARTPLITDGAKMTVTQLEPVEAQGGRALDVSLPSPLIVRGHYGFGRVTVVGLDVDRKPFAEWPDRKDFWVNVLDLRRQAFDSTAALAGTTPSGFYRASIEDLSGSLHTKLEQFAGVRLVPFAYVAGFVFLYILLIGPGDYFFLKKVVRRMELTWVTFPLIVATVSLLAYYSAYAIKGTDLKVNKVDALDIDQTGKSPRARGTAWFTLFSPQNRDYNLAIDPISPEADPADPAPSSPSSVRPEILLSFFGAPDGPFGMNAQGGLALATRPYAYAPADTPRTLEGVRVPIWSTKSFLGRWSGASAPAVATELQQAGPDRLAGTVTNLLPHRTLRGAIPGHGAILIYGKQYYDLGELKPNQVKPVGELVPLILSSEVDRVRDKLPGYVPYQANVSGLGNVTATELVFEAMFADSAGTGGTRVVNLPLRYLDLTGQLALDRPMLVAAIDGPVATLDLGKDAPAPKSDQSTVLRVILPPPAPE